MPKSIHASKTLSRKNSRSTRTKALSISPKVKKIVWERDHHRCIFCHSPYAFPEAHVVPRSKGGMGVEENIVTVCRNCHRAMDQSTDREKYLEEAKAYLKARYEAWSEEEVRYTKWKM